MNQRGDSTRQTILARSLALFAERGVDAVGVREIGAAVGISNPALFRHFASKDQLATDLFHVCYGRLVAALRTAARSDDFEAWLAIALAEIAAEPGSVLYVMDNLRRYFHTLPAALRSDNLPSLVTAMIGREQAAGRFRPDVDVPLATTLILGVLGQTARSVHFHDSELDVPDHARRLATLLGRGLVTQRGHS